MKSILSIIVSLIPFNFLKVFLFNSIFNYEIDYKTKIGFFNILVFKKGKIKESEIGNFNIIIVNSIKLDRARIIKFNRIKKVNLLIMESNSIINKHNLIIGNDTHNIYIGRSTAILVNMLIDVSDNITLGTNVCFAGTGTQLWTHSYDARRILTTKPIKIGSEIYIGSRCLINPGIEICDDVTIGGGTVVSKDIKESGLYVSSTLIRKK